MRTLGLIAILVLAACAPTPPKEAALPSSTPVPSRSESPLPDIVPGGSWHPLDTADVFLDAGMAAGDVTDVMGVIAADIAAIEEHFGHAFPSRPRVALLKDGTSFAAALRPDAPPAVRGAAAVALPSLRQILINVEAARRSKPLSVVRHELSHLMLSQVTQSHPYIPLWFNEGLARLMEETVPGFEWQAELGRITVASRAAIGDLPDPERLRSSGQWYTAVDQTMAEGGQLSPYWVAAEMVRALRDDLGPERWRAFFDALRKTQLFDVTYGRLMGRSFEDFLASLPDRFRTLVPAAPGARLVRLPQGPAIAIYGLSPGTSTAVTITGAGPAPLFYRSDVGAAGLVILRLSLEPTGALHATVSGQRAFAAPVSVP